MFDWVLNTPLVSSCSKFLLMNASAYSITKTYLSIPTSKTKFLILFNTQEVFSNVLVYNLRGLGQTVSGTLKSDLY